MIFDNFGLQHAI